MSPEAMETIRKLFADDADAIADRLDGYPEVAAEIEAFMIKRIWNRPGLALRDKCLVTLVSQAALGRWEQVGHHMNSFRNNGGTTEELKGVALQLAAYCGFPVAVKMFRMIEGE